MDPAQKTQVISIIICFNNTWLELATFKNFILLPLIAQATETQKEANKQLKRFLYNYFKKF